MIPIIRLPFARARFVTADYLIYENEPIKELDDLPNVQFTLHSPEGDKKVQVVYDRFYRRADARNEKKMQEYSTSMIQAIEQTIEREPFQKHFGAGTIDPDEIREALMNPNRPTSRISCGSVETLRGTLEMTNFLHISLNRDVYFSSVGFQDFIAARQNHQFHDRKANHNCVLGIAEVFGKMTGFVLGHPFVDLREVFNATQLATFVVDEIKHTFPWLLEKKLFQIDRIYLEHDYNPGGKRMLAPDNMATTGAREAEVD